MKAISLGLMLTNVSVYGAISHFVRHHHCVGYSQECQSPPTQSTIFVEPGSDFCLNCPLSGSSVSWTKSFDDISSRSYVTIFPNHSVLVRSLTQDRAGSYQCVVDNDFANTYSVTVELSSKCLVFDCSYFVKCCYFSQSSTIYQQSNTVQ